MAWFKTTTEFILPIIAGVHVNIFTQTLQTLGGNGHLLCYQEGNNLATTRFMMFIQELQIIKSTHKSCSGIGNICSKGPNQIHIHRGVDTAMNTYFIVHILCIFIQSKIIYLIFTYRL